MNRKRIGTLLVVCAIVFAFAVSMTASADNITKIEIYPATMEYTGGYLGPYLIGTTSGKNTVDLDNTIAVWSSSNPSVATVTATGEITFTGNKGIAVITATYGKLKATMKAITDFRLYMDQIYFNTEPQELFFSAIDNNGHWVDGDFKFSCSNPEVATIDSVRRTITFSGKKGTATIKVSLGGVSASRTITVAPKLEIDDILFTTGSAVTFLHASASYNQFIKIDISDKAVWSSSNKNVADISADGKAISYTGKPGVTRITCNYGGVSVNKNVYVDATYMIPEEFGYDDHPLSLSVVANYGVSMLQAIPSDSIVWQTSNRAVATVDQNGLVTFTGKTGVVKIIATVYGKYVTSVETFVQPQPFLK